ncbi:hypothetical protein J6590_058705 [Homalodisca vitripennis]|nr:hypothetical protein J6590_058705 [Homalodisca vitripennis]
MASDVAKKTRQARVSVKWKLEDWWKKTWRTLMIPIIEQDITKLQVANYQPSSVAELRWYQVPKQHYWSSNFEVKMMWWNAWRIKRVQELYWVVYRIFYFHHRVHRLVMDNLIWQFFQ